MRRCTSGTGMTTQGTTQAAWCCTSALLTRCCCRRRRHLPRKLRLLPRSPPLYSSSAPPALMCTAAYSINAEDTAALVTIWPACASDLYSFSATANATRMWAMGGFRLDGSSDLDNVYTSTDGFTTAASSSFPGPGTLYAGGAYLANRNLLYVSGKYNSAGLQSSLSPMVFVSTDQGATFTVATASVPFHPRSDLCSTAIPSTNIAVGQGYTTGPGLVALTDCWMSTDGVAPPGRSRWRWGRPASAAQLPASVYSTHSPAWASTARSCSPLQPLHSTSSPPTMPAHSQPTTRHGRPTRPSMRRWTPTCIDSPT